MQTQKQPKSRLKPVVPAVAAAMPSDGFMRLPQIIGDEEADPPVVGVFPVSKSSWWRGIREGRFPKPVKLGPNTTGWRVQDIRDLLERAELAA